MKTHYRLAFTTIGKGIWILIRSWGVTLNRLLNDVLSGIRRHWFFVLVLIAAYVVMFLTMTESRMMYHNGEQINYQLTQEIDSLQLLTGGR